MSNLPRYALTHEKGSEAIVDRQLPVRADWRRQFERLSRGRRRTTFRSRGGIVTRARRLPVRLNSMAFCPWLPGRAL